MSSDAEYYQEHKDDESEWGETVRAPKGARRRLAAMISIRFSPSEVRLVRAAAAALGESVSTFIRQAALMRARRPHLALGSTATVAEWTATTVLPSSYAAPSTNMEAPDSRFDFATYAESRAG
jgi:hypothetical protein